MIEDLRAVAFTLEYDPAFYSNFFALSVPPSAGNLFMANDDTPGLIDYSLYVLDSDNSIESGNLLILRFNIREDFPADFPTDETQVRLRNIRGFLSDGHVGCSRRYDSNATGLCRYGIAQNRGARSRIIV